MAITYISSKEVIKILEEGKPHLPKESGPMRSLKLEYSQLIDNMIKKIENLNEFEVSLKQKYLEDKHE